MKITFLKIKLLKTKLLKPVWIFALILMFCFLPNAIAWSAELTGELTERLANFPQWEKLTSVKPAKGDLIYPEWMAGKWLVKSTLVDLVAPLAPEIIAPGFEGNRQYLNQPIEFPVRFIEQKNHLLKINRGSKLIPRVLVNKSPDAISNPREDLLPTVKSINTSISGNSPINSPISSREINSREINSREIIADRAYNSLNIARAYLGDDIVLSVKLDPESPNRQITQLRGDRQLVTLITARAVETPGENDYTTTEVFQQLFKDKTFKNGAQSVSNPYFNSVESTTAYHYHSGIKSNSKTQNNPIITADQVTAVYLSPQDPNYFKAASRVIALYRYQLEFFPLDS